MKEHIIAGLEKGIRPDGRKLTEYREIKVEAGTVNNAEGSAKVTIGDTEILVGIKMSLEKPYSDQPNKGTMAFGAELLPMSSQRFESGPPGIEAIELARVTDRGIRESGVIDTAKLCIEPGEKVWMVMADIITINAAGNLFDAAALGSMVALQDTKFPKIVEGVVDYEKSSGESLPLSKVPVSVTVLKIGKYLIIDPIEEEEAIADARLTTVFEKDGTICAMQKGGVSPLTIDEIDSMVELAALKSKELRKFLENSKV